MARSTGGIALFGEMFKAPPPGEWKKLFEHRPECKSAEGSWEGLGFGNRRRRFPAGRPRFLQTRGCVKQKSLQRPPTICFTDSVLRTRFLIIILRFGGGVGGGGGGGCGGGGGDFNISPNSKICPTIHLHSVFGKTDRISLYGSVSGSSFRLVPEVSFLQFI